MLLLCGCPYIVHAQIYRCVGAQGEPAFSGEPCGAPASTASTAGTRGSGFGDHCAASPDALRHAIGQAFATHDVNRLAGLIVWRGIDQASARSELRQLATWLQQALTGITVIYAGGVPPGDTSASATTDTDAQPATDSSAGRVPVGLLVSTSASANPRDFGIAPMGRCWWLSF
ncbi:MAG TPA: hypothetical protein VFQ95_03225 [Rhodanobacteraceae bacterium]|nr:hypothetical protein [Rhodanobacteraceae bacterium]